MTARPLPAEVLVTVDGRVRTARLLQRDGARAQVRWRDETGWHEQWVPATAVVDVEATPEARSFTALKLVGLAAAGVVGLVLVTSGGSDRRLADVTTSPSPAVTVSPTPSPAPSITAPPVAFSPSPATTVVPSVVLFGDSFVTGRGIEPGRPTAAQVAARQLSPWRVAVRGGDGTAFTTGGTRGGRPYAARLATEVVSAPTLLLLQGGTSDTGATPEQLTAAATAAVDRFQARFPRTRIVMMGPIGMQRPYDGQLVRVDATLRAVATAEHVAYLDPIRDGWVPDSLHLALTADDGYYPNARGQDRLGRLLAAALRRLV